MGMNPWKIIGWILLVFMLLSLTFCGLVCVRVAKNSPQYKAANDPNYRPQLTLISTSCDANHGRPRADIAVRNSGTVELEFAKAFISFGGTVHDSYISPSTLPVGSTGTITAYANSGESANCRLDSVQDRSGQRIPVLN